MSITVDNILFQAACGNIEVLNSDLIYDFKIKDKGRNSTPLHLLAIYCGPNPLTSSIEDTYLSTKKELKFKLLNHPLIDKVFDYKNFTPLHYLALVTNFDEILEHPSVDKVKSFSGETPLHVYIKTKGFPFAWMRKRYPWYCSCGSISEIINPGNAVKFIFGK